MTKEQSHIRFDQRLKQTYPELSRAYISKLISEGKAKINNQVSTKPSQNVSDQDKSSLKLPLRSKIKNLKIPIIYEDGHVIVVDKPKGVLSHSKGDYSNEPTVATWLAANLDVKAENNRDGIVHRLDRDTSGVMIVAKDQETALYLQKQFSMRKVNKVYVAVIEGNINPSEAIIDLPIERNPKKPQTFRVGANGKASQTEYKTLKSNDKFSLLELKPKTGRTHQLRVHLKHLSHPILGDKLYGGQQAERLYLHANKLGLTLPNGERKEFESKVPNEFKKLVG